MNDKQQSTEYEEGFARTDPLSLNFLYGFYSLRIISRGDLVHVVFAVSLLQQQVKSSDETRDVEPRVLPKLEAHLAGFPDVRVEQRAKARKLIVGELRLENQQELNVRRQRV